MSRLLVVCGPTGSGKTKFAHEIALKNNGEIINCDSMQIYNEIPILTASPSQALQCTLPYHLYNFHHIRQEFSSTKYVHLAVNVIKSVINRGKLPIIVGGTGMYINSLLYGYNEIPEISPEIRTYIREFHQTIGQENFYKLLHAIDQRAILTIKPNDTQRTLRAYEVFKQTGKSIISFQEQGKIFPLAHLNFEIIFLNPERHLLYQICNKRLIDIFHNGAIEEVKNIKDSFSLPINSAAKAIGLQELLDYLDNKISLDEAITLAQQRTRKYAKRQVTWFKHQLKEKRILEYSTLKELEQIIHEFSL